MFVRLMRAASLIGCSAVVLLAAERSIPAAGLKPRPFDHPLVFEPNVGQAAPEVTWLARGPGYQLFLTADGATMVHRDAAASASPSSAPQPLSSDRICCRQAEPNTRIVRMKLKGSRAWNTVSGLEPTGGASNYFLGNDPKRWHADIPHYARLLVKGVYDGIDLVLYSHGGELEYDFVVAPFADPKQIRLTFDGVERMRVDSPTGDLLLTTSNGELRERRPTIYQQAGNRRVEVAGAYELLDRGQAAFALAAYNRRIPLVIDPTVVFTGHLSGSDYDSAQGIAVDATGNSYIIGVTYSSNFPVAGGIPRFSTGHELFVTKLSATGAIVFSTYLGGTGEDIGNAIAVDSTGVYLTGSTTSPDFPTQRGFILHHSGSDAFVTKLSPAGNALVYSTYLGGSSYDVGYGIAVDASQSAYVVGQTSSIDFPIVAPLQHNYAGPSDIFVTKLSSAGTSLAFSTFWGGSGADQATGVAVDANGYIYVTGQTWSSDFPSIHQLQGYQTIGATTFNNAFVLKLYQNSHAVYSTCLGGGSDYGTSIAADSLGNAYVTGSTSSLYFPTTVGAYQAVPVSPYSSAFYTKLNNAGGLTYSTYLGGSDGSTHGYGIAITGAGEAYVVGETTSTRFPQAPHVAPNPVTGFLAKFAADGGTLQYATLMGAHISAVAVFRSASLYSSFPKVYFAGSMYSGQTAALAGLDAFAAELDENPYLFIGVKAF